MAKTNNHRRDDTAPADLAGEEFATVPPVTDPDGAVVASDAPPAEPRWLVSIPGCHPEDLVVGAVNEAAAVEIYKARLGITALPVAAVVTPAEAPEAAPAPE